MKLNNKKGFSLIELSIVLIIIGLLIAGITGGASLIKSAELRAVMSEIRNYQTAVNAYYTAKGELPGSTNSNEMSFADTGVAWGNLFDEGITDSEPGTTAGSATELNASYGMTSKVKGAFYVLGYNDEMEQNVLFLISTPGTTTEDPADLKDIGNGTVTALTNASITRKDAKFLDDKMDNGVIDSGKVWSFTGGSTTCAYDDTTAQNCVIAFGIGI
ncbi:MAG: prepilin-type N-terminal cleavage/methylation domain-containing protein [Rickettsiales bacterium]|nr:prepilin-type N-terminal cleavage/methylation domain-containing protein [Rickettsiales bacterium]